MIVMSFFVLLVNMIFCKCPNLKFQNGDITKDGVCVRFLNLFLKITLSLHRMFFNVRTKRLLGEMARI